MPKYDKDERCDLDDYVLDPQCEENPQHERESWQPDEPEYPGDHNKTACTTATVEQNSSQKLRREWFNRRIQIDPYTRPQDVPTFEELEAQLEELRNSPTGRSLLDIALDAQRLSIVDSTSTSAQLVRDKEH